MKTSCNNSRGLLQELEALKEKIILSGKLGLSCNKIKLSAQVILFIIQKYLFREGYTFNFPFEDIRLENIVKVIIFAPQYAKWRYFGADSIWSGNFISEDCIIVFFDLLIEAGINGLSIAQLQTKLKALKNDENKNNNNIGCDIHLICDRIIIMGFALKKFLIRNSTTSPGTFSNIILKKYCNDSPNNSAILNFRDSILLKDGILWDYLKWILEKINKDNITFTELGKMLKVKSKKIRVIRHELSQLQKPENIFLPVFAFEQENSNNIWRLGLTTTKMNKNPPNTDINACNYNNNNNQTNSNNNKKPFLRNLSLFEQLCHGIKVAGANNDGITTTDIRDLTGLPFKRSAKIATELTSQYKFPSVRIQDGKNIRWKILPKKELITTTTDQLQDEEIESKINTKQQRERMNFILNYIETSGNICSLLQLENAIKTNLIPNQQGAKFCKRSVRRTIDKLVGEDVLVVESKAILGVDTIIIFSTSIPPEDREDVIVDFIQRIITLAEEVRMEKELSEEANNKSDNDSDSVYRPSKRIKRETTEKNSNNNNNDTNTTNKEKPTRRRKRNISEEVVNENKNELIIEVTTNSKKVKSHPIDLPKYRNDIRLCYYNNLSVSILQSVQPSNGFITICKNLHIELKNVLYSMGSLNNSSVDNAQFRPIDVYKLFSFKFLIDNFPLFTSLKQSEDNNINQISKYNELIKTAISSEMTIESFLIEEEVSELSLVGDLIKNDIINRLAYMFCFLMSTNVIRVTKSHPDVENELMKTTTILINNIISDYNPKLDESAYELMEKTFYLILVCERCDDLPLLIDKHIIYYWTNIVVPSIPLSLGEKKSIQLFENMSIVSQKIGNIVKEKVRTIGEKFSNDLLYESVPNDMIFQNYSNFCLPIPISWLRRARIRDSNKNSKIQEITNTDLKSQEEELNDVENIAFIEKFLLRFLIKRPIQGLPDILKSIDISEDMDINASCFDIDFSHLFLDSVHPSQLYKAAISCKSVTNNVAKRIINSLIVKNPSIRQMIAAICCNKANHLEQSFLKILNSILEPNIMEQSKINLKDTYNSIFKSFIQLYSQENNTQDLYKELFSQFDINDVLIVHREMFVNNFVVRNTKETYSEKDHFFKLSRFFHESISGCQLTPYFLKSMETTGYDSFCCITNLPHAQVLDSQSSSISAIELIATSHILLLNQDSLNYQIVITPEELTNNDTVVIKFQADGNNNDNEESNKSTKKTVTKKTTGFCNLPLNKTELIVDINDNNNSNYLDKNSNSSSSIKNSENNVYLWTDSSGQVNYTLKKLLSGKVLSLLGTKPGGSFKYIHDSLTLIKEDELKQFLEMLCNDNIIYYLESKVTLHLNDPFLSEKQLYGNYSGLYNETNRRCYFIKF